MWVKNVSELSKDLIYQTVLLLAAIESADREANAEPINLLDGVHWLQLGSKPVQTDS